MTNNIAIKVENLFKIYTLKEKNISDKGAVGQTVALQNIHLEIKKGESVGIIGHNGSGKSTLLKILAGVTPPSKGKVEIYGKVASILEIGSGFHPELTGKENVFLNGQLLGFSEKIIADQLDSIVEFSGIKNFINEPVKNYSNGMYLRLAFSIIANLDFDVYLLDEVMSVGDAAFQLKVNQFLQKQRENQEKTFVFVSHDMQSIIAASNYCYLFENGKLINKGSRSLIENYLEKSYESVNQTELPSGSRIFLNQKNDFITLQKVSVNKEKCFEDESIPFQCNLVSKHNCKLDIAFGIQNLMSQEICYFSTLIEKDIESQKIHRNERFEAIVHLPPYTLKPGTYILTLSIVLDEVKIAIQNMKILEFSIIKSKKEQIVLIRKRPNSAHIKSIWKFKIIN
jgi:ABC-type polysaccharide/polyol phosphate transport system ATPase subunit